MHPTDTPSDAAWLALAPNVWSLTHHFHNMGLRISTRMSVIRLRDGSLLAHSAVPLSREQDHALRELGELRHIVAPNAMHHLFVGHVLARHPQAKVYGPPSLQRKRPELPWQPLPEPNQPAPWAPELRHWRFEGIPMLDESSWFHAPSGTLFMGDVCQLWRGPLSLPVRAYLGLTGGYERLTVPRTVRLITRDTAAARASAQALLALPVERIALLHNTVLANDPKTQLTQAFSVW